MSVLRDPAALDGRRFAELRDELTALVRAYVPEWRLDPDAHEPGAALVKAYAHLFEVLAARLDRAPRRRALAMLNQLGARLVAARSARAPLRFRAVPGTSAPIPVPVGTAAAASGADGPIVFETRAELLVHPAGIVAAFGVDPFRDVICRPPAGFLDGESQPQGLRYRTLALAAADATRLTLQHSVGLAAGHHLRIGGGTGQLVRLSEDPNDGAVRIEPALLADVPAEADVERVIRFAPFDGIDEQEHAWYVGDELLLKLDEPATIAVSAQVSGALGGREVRWQAWSKEGDEDPRWVGLDAAGSDLLGAPSLRTSGKLEARQLLGKKGFWIRCKLEQKLAGDPPPSTAELPRLQDVKLVVKSGTKNAWIEPDLVFSNTTQVDPNAEGGALAFGELPRLFDALYFASAEAFSKRGAGITVDIEAGREAAPLAAFADGEAVRVFRADARAGVMSGTAGPDGNVTLSTTDGPMVLQGTDLTVRGSEVLAWGTRGNVKGLFRLHLVGSTWTWERLPNPFDDLALAGSCAGAGQDLYVVTLDGHWMRWAAGTLTDLTPEGAGRLSAPFVANDGDKSCFVVADQSLLRATTLGSAEVIDTGPFVPDSRHAVHAYLEGTEWHLAVTDVEHRLWLGSGVLNALRWRSPGRPGGEALLASRPMVLVERSSGVSYRQRVFVRAASGQLFEWRETDDGGRWVQHQVGAGLASAPAIVAIPPVPFAVLATSAGGIRVRELVHVLDHFSSSRRAITLSATPADNVVGKRLVSGTRAIPIEGFVERLRLVQVGSDPAIDSGASVSIASPEALGQFVIVGGDLTTNTLTLRPDPAISGDPADDVTVPGSVLQLRGPAEPAWVTVQTIANTAGGRRQATFVPAISSGTVASFNEYRVHSAEQVSCQLGSRRCLHVPAVESASRLDLIGTPVAAGIRIDDADPESAWILLDADWTTGVFALPLPVLVAGTIVVGGDGPDPIRLAWEYWNGSGWVGLERSGQDVDWPFADQTNSFLSSGQVRFTIPSELKQTAVLGQDNHWIRVRLVGGSYVRETFPTENGELVTKREGPGAPRLTRLKIHYELAPTPPQHVLTYNNLQWRDQSDASRAGRDGFAPFEALEARGRALYLGAGSAVQGAWSLLAETLEWEERRTRFAWSSLARGEWHAASAEDDSHDLTRTGIVRFVPVVPTDLESRFDVAAHWVCAEEEGADEAQRAASPRRVVLGALHANTTWADQVRTVRDEILGSSDGEPGQEFALSASPVQGVPLIYVREVLDGESLERLDPERILRRLGAAGREETWLQWTLVEDLSAADADARVFELDAALGLVRFGDGLHGRVPPADASNLLALEYRVGGGVSGNVAAGQVSALVTAVAGLSEVTNPLAAGGGSDTAGVEVSARLASERLAHGRRAVTAEDFERLALAFDPELVRARCLVDHAAARAGRETWIRVAVLARSSARVPVPGLSLREALAERLREVCHGMLSVPVRLAIVPPRFVEVRVAATLVVSSANAAARVGDEAQRRIQAFLHPVRGGRRHEGWEFGRRPEVSDVLAVLAQLEGVEVEDLALRRAADDAELAAFGARELVASAESHALVIVLRGGQSP